MSQGYRPGQPHKFASAGELRRSLPGMLACTKTDEEAFARSVFRRRWLNALQRVGVTTVGEVRGMSQRRLLEIPQVGPKAVADISAALRDPRLCSGDSIELLGALQARVVSERDRELVRMRQQGAGVAVIARRFGITRVRQILDRDGW
jgi:hypothetical protein